MEYKIKRTRRSFMILGLAIIILSLIGIFSFSVLDFKIIHPVIYLFGILMGSGWFLTAYASR